MCTRDFSVPADPSKDFSDQIGHVRAIRVTGFDLAVTFDMAGVSWDYINQLHRRYGFHERWPDGMLCHITGLSASGIISLGIWTNAADERAFFTRVASSVITDSIREQGAPITEDGASADFSPYARELHRLTIGSDVGSFVDIGEDADATAIGVLGSEPVTVQIDLNGVDADAFDSAMRELGYDQQIPDGLLVQCVELSDGQLFESQCWASEDSARAALNSEYLPALQTVGANPTASFHRLKRISFGGASCDPGWFPVQSS